MGPCIKLFLASIVLGFCRGGDDHCCREKTVGDKTYMLVESSDEAVTGYGCESSCVYTTPESSSKFCFKPGPYQVVCLSTQIGLETFFMEKTKEYGEITKYQNYTEKAAWVDKDLLNTNEGVINTTSVPKFIDKLLEAVTAPKSEKILNSINEIVQISYACHINICSYDQLKQELTKIENKMIDSTSEYQELQDAIKNGVQAAKFIAKFFSKESPGVLHRADQFVKSILANTDWRNTEFNMDNCAQEITQGAVGGAIAACASISGGCSKIAINAAINGVMIGAKSCIPQGIFDCPPECCGYLICFATTSQVETMSGLKGISELVIGDYVRTSSGGNETHFTEFLGWLGRTKSTNVSMLHILTSQKKSTLTLTGNHIVFTPASYKYAKDLVAGDKLLHWNGSNMEELDVTEILPAFSYGSWAPLTRDGTLLVDGIMSSCYSAFPHEVIDLAMLPVKENSTHLLDNEVSQYEDGARPVVKMIKMTGKLDRFLLDRFV